MDLQFMPLINRIKAFVDTNGITRYQFCKDTGLTQNTGYRLYKDPNYIPGSDALLKICKAYKIQPGVLIEYVPEDDSDNHEAISEQEASKEPRNEGKSTTPSQIKWRSRDRSFITVAPKWLSGSLTAELTTSLEDIEWP